MICFFQIAYNVISIIFIYFILTRFIRNMGSLNSDRKREKENPILYLRCFEDIAYMNYHLAHFYTQNFKLKIIHTYIRCTHAYSSSFQPRNLGARRMVTLKNTRFWWNETYLQPALSIFLFWNFPAATFLHKPFSNGFDICSINFQ